MLFQYSISACVHIGICNEISDTFGTISYMNHSITCSIAVLYSYSTTKWQRKVSILHRLANFVPLTLTSYVYNQLTTCCLHHYQ